MVSWKYNSALQFQLFFGTNSNSVLGRRAYNMAGRVLAMARAKAAILAAVCISIAAGRGATHCGWRPTLQVALRGPAVIGGDLSFRWPRTPSTPLQSTGRTACAERH